MILKNYVCFFSFCETYCILVRFCRPRLCNLICSKQRESTERKGVRKAGEMRKGNGALSAGARGSSPPLGQKSRKIINFNLPWIAAIRSITCFWHLAFLFFERKCTFTSLFPFDKSWL